MTPFKELKNNLSQRMRVLNAFSRVDSENEQEKTKPSSRKQPRQKLLSLGGIKFSCVRGC